MFDQRDERIERLSTELHAAKQTIAKLERSNASLVKDRNKIASRCLHAEERSDSLHTHIGDLRRQLVNGDGPAERELLDATNLLAAALGTWIGPLVTAACERIQRCAELEQQVADANGDGCNLHGDAPHGMEAEELRRGIEDLLMASARIGIGSSVSWRDRLRSLLDRVDARDSLSHVRANEELAELRKQNAELIMELGGACCKRALAVGVELVEPPVLAAGPCLDPDKMHGAGDQFGGSDFEVTP